MLQRRSTRADRIPESRSARKLRSRTSGSRSGQNGRRSDSSKRHGCTATPEIRAVVAPAGAAEAARIANAIAAAIRARCTNAS